ncbi:hypothetical protein Tco_0980371 [Tanacetum coccineum]
MCTYLKNMEGYKVKDLKSKGFDSIQEMFDRAFKRNAKKQKVEDDKETVELKQCLEIIPDEEEVAIDAIPLSIRDPLRRICHLLITHTISGRGQAPEKVTRTDLYFLKSMDQEGTTVVVRELAPGPERQPIAVAGAPRVIEGAPNEEEGEQAVLAPVQAPQPPPTARTMP